LYEFLNTRRPLATLKELWSNRLILIGNVILWFWVVVAIFAQFIAPYPSQGLNGTPDPSSKLLAPSLSHLFGTNELGLDLFSRVLFGARIALMVGAIVMWAATSKRV